MAQDTTWRTKMLGMVILRRVPQKNLAGNEYLGVKETQFTP
jgi:hypothetical protein